MDRLPKEYRIGQMVTGRVEQVFPFGVFVRLQDGTPAYIRRRELTRAGNVDPREALSVNQEVQAAVVALPEPGRNLELSVRQIEPDPWEIVSRQFKVRDAIRGTVKGLTAGGVFVEVMPGVDGLIPLEELAPWPVKDPDQLLWIGDQVEATITHLDREKKQLRLSIRKQMAHQARALQIVNYLRAEETGRDAWPEIDEPETRDAPWFDLHGVGRVLVIDDHPAVREQLVIWLRQHGCPAEGVASADEGWTRLREENYRLVLVDLDRQDRPKAIRALRESGLETPILGMGVPEWIAEQSRELEAVGILDVFLKPLNLDEILDTLVRVARGESVGPYRASPLSQSGKTAPSFQQFAQMMRQSSPLEERLEAGLAELIRLTHAELAVLFHWDPISRQMRIMALAGELPIDHSAEYTLAASPVKDLILEGERVFKPRLSEHDKRRFQKLLDMVAFQSCIGVPVSVGGWVEHALFLFHREPNALTGLHLRHAYAMAALLGAALESKAVEERLRAESAFLLSGKLAAGFGHDVFNKMSALELQARNLCALYETSTRSPDPLAYEQLGETIDQLMRNTLDLKQTVEAFRDLIRAEEWGAFDLNSLLQQAVALLRTMAHRHQVSIRLDLAPDLPPVVGSPVRLEQVFLNIMLNALQQMSRKLEQWPAGVAVLRIRTGLEAEADRPLWVRFSDTGPGIHRRLWEEIFALGYSTRPGGTGLGLFIVRCLVESMGGTICVEESPVPLGTTFRVELPIAPQTP
ncbi:MAG: S1 RNA-binding domain-containing protein [Anaerolineae bacterium]